MELGHRSKERHLLNGHVTVGSNGCKVIRAGTGTRETNNPHNYTRLPLPPPPPPPIDISIRLIGVIGHGARIAVARDFTRVYIGRIRVDDNRYTTYIYLGVCNSTMTSKQLFHSFDTICTTPSLRCDSPPLFENGEGKEGGRGAERR